MNAKRLEVVDGLRAFAVVSVVLFHTFTALAAGGFIGVDVFFVISGFVIALRYLQPLVQQETTFREFFVRRIRRLVPAYFVFILAVTAVATYLLKPLDLMNFGSSLIGQALYAQNIVFWFQGDYFDKPLLKPLLHTWSLAIEEQFYLAFPLLILLIRWRPSFAVVAMVAAAGVSIAAGWYIGSISPKTAFYWLPFRAWEFLAGILAALAWQKGLVRAMRSDTATAIGLAGLAAILAAVLLFDGSAGFPSVQAALAVAGTAAICLTQHKLQFPWVFTNPLSQHFGRISYSWYLWHWPPISFFYVVAGRHPDFPEAVALSLIGYALGALSYRHVERWGLRSSVLRPPRRSAAMLAAFLLIAAATGSLTVAHKGFIERYPQEVQPLLAAQLDRPAYRCPYARRLAAASEQICRLNDVEGSGGILIIGDSHADVVKDGLAAYGEKSGVPIYLTKQNCRLVDYGVDANCAAAVWTQIARDIEKHKITDVLAVSLWPVQPQDGQFDIAVSRTLATGVDLHVQRSWPESTLLDPGTHGSISEPSTYSLADHMSLRRNEYRTLNRLAKANPRVHLIDPIPILCPNQCAFVIGGRPIYSDSNHLNSWGAKLILPLHLTVIRSARGIRNPRPLAPRNPQV